MNFVELHSTGHNEKQLSSVGYVLFNNPL
jgi:hypothetical protein